MGRIGTPSAVRALVAILGVGDDVGGGLERTPVREALVGTGTAAVPQVAGVLSAPARPMATTSAAWVLGEVQAKEAPRSSRRCGEAHLRPRRPSTCWPEPGRATVSQWFWSSRATPTPWCVTKRSKPPRHSSTPPSPMDVQRAARPRRRARRCGAGVDFACSAAPGSRGPCAGDARARERGRGSDRRVIDALGMLARRLAVAPATSSRSSTRSVIPIRACACTRPSHCRTRGTLPHEKRSRRSFGRARDRSRRVLGAGGILLACPFGRNRGAARA